MTMKGQLLSSAVGLTLLTVVSLYYMRKSKKEDRKIKKGNQSLSSNSNVAYDVAIVGAGPAGSTAAFFLGKLGYRVALIDKKSFPRPKPCGDAFCKPALDLLSEMGILSQMENDKVVHPVTRGGLISPFGYECINTDGGVYGSVTGCKTYAIKRYIADEYIVKAAVKNNTVALFESREVIDAIFHETSNPNETGYYKVDIKDSTSDLKGSVYATFILICDGSTSYLGQKLGIIPKSQSQAQCSHAYIKDHQWYDKDNLKAADGVMIFNSSILPGYSALFRHSDETVYLGTYILPGGRATSRAIAPFESELIENHPYVRSSLGQTYQYDEKRVVAPIRVGGVEKSYSKQLFLVGDSAGMVDPLTGEGIHTAMIAGKIVAGVIDEMIKNHNYTIDAHLVYEKRCYDAFGYEFWSSAIMAKIIYWFPVAIDAITVVGRKRGQPFLDFFGECMTGVRPKSEFLTDIFLLSEVTVEVFKQIIIQYVLRKKPLIPSNIGHDIVNKQYKSKAS